MLDTTNVNSRDCRGLKQCSANTVPMLLWVGCGNHKLALFQTSAATLQNYTRNRNFFRFFKKVF